MAHILFRDHNRPERKDAERNHAWFWLLPASLTEVAWISGVKSSSTLSEWSLTAVAVVASVILALKATRYMSATTVYIVFVALGTIGTFVVNLTIYGQSFSFLEVALLMTLVAGIIGLKSTTGE